VKSILRLVQNNQETLLDLSLHWKVWKSEELKTMIFPKLKRLTATIGPEEQETLEAFLSNHSKSLEELDIAVDVTEVKFSSSLLRTIKKLSTNLKKLHLQAEEFEGDTVDWSFLREMKCLQDFRISRPYSGPFFEVNEQGYGTGPRFLESLPRNQLQRLSFKGIRDGKSFWKTKIGNDTMEPDLQLKLDLLGGFRNLKCLRFERCGNAVDDQVIQFIFREISRLEEFHISHCKSLTDAGIAGGTNPEQSDKKAVSIQNLKGPNN